MKTSLALRLLRDVTAVLVVGIFMFPLFWWGLTSFKPTSAIFNKDEVVFFDFEPTLVNYQVVLMGKSRAELAIESGSTFGVGGTSSYDSRQTIIDSLVVAIGSTILTVFAGVTAAYALSRMRFRGQQAYLNWILSQRFVPPIAIIVPVVFMFHYMGLRDTLLGLIFIHTLIISTASGTLMRVWMKMRPSSVSRSHRKWNMKTTGTMMAIGGTKRCDRIQLR